MTSPARSSRPELVALGVPGPREPWERLGLARPGLHFGADRLTAVLAGLDPAADVGGLPLVPGERGGEPVEAIDHVVAMTPDFEATKARLVAAGFDHRRDRESGGGRRQAFFVIGPALLELVGPAGEREALWGITFVTEDLAAAKRRMGDQLSEPKDAVQPGRRIATVRREAGLGLPVALMTPR